VQVTVSSCAGCGLPPSSENQVIVEVSLSILSSFRTFLLDKIDGNLQCETNNLNAIGVDEFQEGQVAKFATSEGLGECLYRDASIPNGISSKCTIWYLLKSLSRVYRDSGQKYGRG